MDISEIRTGTKLELELYDEDGIRQDKILISKFEWKLGENTAMIAAPIHEGVVYPVRIGSVVNINFSQKKDGAIYFYRFRAHVRDRRMDGNLALLKIEAEGEFEKIQRRQYFRLDCSIAVFYRLINTFNESRNEGIKFKKTLAVNLSGGGIGLMLEEKAELGRLVECEMQTEPNKKIRFFGKVVRCDETQTDSPFKYSVGVVFVRIGESDREAVVKYIFNEQRILRKKGLI